MIQVDDLCLSYDGEPILEDVSFTINSKERCGLVGRNGSGKTTLFRLLIGKEKPDVGTISFSKGYRLGYLDQHIRFTCPTVIEEACLGLQEHEREDRYKAEKILFGLGIKEEELEITPTQMSGGYQLRLHLTKVLLSEPDCLLLDEPTNYLDILSIRFLMRFLKQWKSELILISHDREFMDNITTHTMGVHRKQVKKIKGDSTAYYEQILQQEEIHERTRVNLEKKRAHLQSYIDRFGAKASKAAQAQSRQKMLNRIPALEQLKALYNLDFSFLEHPFYGRKMLEMNEVDFVYDDSKPLIRGFSIEIENKDRIAIIGKNGYGKSTLLRLMAGDLIPIEGNIRVMEQVATGYFGQTNIQRLNDNLSIEAEIATANPKLNFTSIRGICGLMMFGGDAAKKKISMLSGGEKSRVLIGKILAKPCNLLLLDEPTHHLDTESIESLIDALEEFQGSFVVVTHSELILKRLSLNKIVICHQDRQEVFFGSYQEFMEKVGWEEERVGDAKTSKSSIKDERKRKQNDWMYERSQLKALESDLQKLEKNLGQLEKIQELQQKELEEATNAFQMEKVHELVKACQQREIEIQSLYEKFINLSQDLEQLKSLLRNR